MSYTYYYKKSNDNFLQALLTKIRDFAKNVVCEGKDEFFEEFKKEFPYEVLGVGGSAFVMKISSTKVIRIEWMEVDSGYLTWLKYSLKNQKLKSIPKIYAAFKFIPDYYNYFSLNGLTLLVTVSERLMPLGSVKMLKNYQKTSLDWLHWFLEADKAEGEKKLKTFESKFKEPFKSAFRRTEYIKIKKEVKGINDIFHKNLMISLNQRRLVITDPIG